MPKAPVATKRAMTPGIAGAMTGMCMRSAFMARPPESVRREKQAVSTTEPVVIKVRRPIASIKSQANVIRRK
jgi:hypothetical protein